MAIKSNTAKAIANIWAYLEGYVEYINDEIVAWNPEMEYIQKGDKKGLARVIWEEFHIEKVRNDCRYKAGRVTLQDLFTDWAGGLPMCGIFDFWGMPTAKKILAQILEETEEEADKFTESEAERTLTYLIYREVSKNANK